MADRGCDSNFTDLHWDLSESATILSSIRIGCVSRRSQVLGMMSKAECIFRESRALAIIVKSARRLNVRLYFRFDCENLSGEPYHQA